MKLSSILGTWTLKDFYIQKDNNKKMWGEHTHGILIYSDDGYMSVAINSATDVLFYAGTYKIINNNTIVHRVLNATNLERIGENMLRKATVTCNHLILEGSGEFGIATLVWEKANHVLDTN